MFNKQFTTQDSIYKGLIEGIFYETVRINNFVQIQHL